MKSLFEFTLAGLLFLGVFTAPVAAGGDIVKVMTRNQYLGADLTPIVLAQTPEEFLAAATAALQQIAANNFPLRARRLAAEVALTRPDLIGLQEVYNFTLEGSNFGPPFVDHLTETLEALAAKGQNYEVAATVENLDITIPIEGIGSVRVLDRDVILVRKGAAFTNLPELCGAFTIPNPAFPLVGEPTLTSTLSEEGCNYNIFAEVNPPVGPPIAIERGFIGVDVTVRGKVYRVVNTHLEQRQPDPTNSASALFQSLQSAVLMGTLQATTPAGVPLILLGDFNSCDEDMPIVIDIPISPDQIRITPPYQIIVDAGFADVWDTNPFKLFDPNGFTCCQDDDLSNAMSLLDERIDIIFVRDTSFRPLAFVTGRVPIFPLRQPPNWASDHGGVFGKLIFRQDAMD